MRVLIVTGDYRWSVSTDEGREAASGVVRRGTDRKRFVEQHSFGRTDLVEMLRPYILAAARFDAAPHRSELELDCTARPLLWRSSRERRLWTQGQIAAQVEAVAQVMVLLGVNAERVRAAQARALHQRGLSLRSIAQLLGVGLRTVRGLLE